jgi:hypothetical protein
MGKKLAPRNVVEIQDAEFQNVKNSDNVDFISPYPDCLPNYVPTAGVRW